MKSNRAKLKPWAILALIVIFLSLGLHFYKIASLSWGNNFLLKNDQSLTYVLYKYGPTLSLDVFEAEKYASAVIVQPLIGNLVYFSNHGRYEPRIAERWERTSPNVWTFYLREGMTCENGEKITAQSFRDSLYRTIFYASKKGDSPIFKNLIGYQEFLKTGKNLKGISAEGNKLIFKFSTPVRSGLIEVLSYAPYGYICADNFIGNGNWKNKAKFISSGPYKITHFADDEVILSLRTEWEHYAMPTAPRNVTIYYELPESSVNYDNLIFDSLFPSDNMPEGLAKYKLVPEYLNAILLGNLKQGYFSNTARRKAFVNLISENRDSYPESFGIHYKAQTFYPAPLQHKKSDLAQKYPEKLVLPQKPLIIEGFEPTEKSFKFESWQILKKSLESVGVPYSFAENDQAWSNIRSENYDIRLRATSIGGTADAWAIDVLFCSTIGPNYPDPNKKICGLIENFENDKINESDFAVNFERIISDDSAIIPISHLGVQLFLGKNIKQTSLSPALNVIRFDQLEME